MSELFNLPQLDEDGYFCGSCTCMNDPVSGDPMLPDNVVNAAFPEEDDKHYYKWDGTAWKAEAKPTTCAECVTLGAVSHQSQTARCAELRQLYQSLVEADSEHFKISRGEDLEWIVEAIPEKTAEEKAAEEKAQRISELKQKLSETDYIAAKIAEGAATKEEYADLLAQRQAWRDEINELEAEDDSDTEGEE